MQPEPRKEKAAFGGYGMIDFWSPVAILETCKELFIPLLMLIIFVAFYLFFSFLRKSLHFIKILGG
jgi:hypothetical protein